MTMIADLAFLALITVAVIAVLVIGARESRLPKMEPYLGEPQWPTQANDFNWGT